MPLSIQEIIPLSPTHKFLHTHRTFIKTAPIFKTEINVLPFDISWVPFVDYCVLQLLGWFFSLLLTSETPRDKPYHQLYMHNSQRNPGRWIRQQTLILMGPDFAKSSAHWVHIGCWAFLEIWLLVSCLELLCVEHHWLSGSICGFQALENPALRLFENLTQNLLCMCVCENRRKR